MDIKSILSKCGVPTENIEAIEEALRTEIPKSFVSKQQYSKKIGQLDELQNTIADLEAKIENSDTDEYKSKYEKLEKDFEDYKNKKNNETKTSVLQNQLREDGVNEKLIKLLAKEFNLETLEIENDKIKNWEELSKPIKENYSDFYSKEVISGVGSGNPPRSNGEAFYTSEQINKMTTEEINANWEAISASLNK